ncbi:MAG: M23 family metallopeptidase [Oscillatoriales cyanobacterium RM2_1_1]|nr:M23 family metallopeptidase [Oscillatoriales cyanobacterium SM2_3_0]NJO47737.1 M23 family metallopeptidase [Oscillatoriales cyanobacterium RM2_1_1]
MRLKIIVNTVFKDRPVSASELAYEKKTSASLGTEFEISTYAWAPNKHLKISFIAPLPRDQKIWYVFFDHVQLFDRNLVPIDLTPIEVPPEPGPGSATVGESPPKPKIPSSKWRWPLTGTSMNAKTEFGYARGRLHAGVDIGGYTADECYAASDGQVTYIKGDRGGAEGRMLEITRPDGWKHLYLHLRSIQVELNQAIAMGELIGIRGGSGFGSEGLEIDGGGYSIHLHFEVRDPAGKPVNPRNILPADGSVPILE